MDSVHVWEEDTKDVFRLNVVFEGKRTTSFLFA